MTCTHEFQQGQLVPWLEQQQHPLRKVGTAKRDTIALPGIKWLHHALATDLRALCLGSCPAAFLAVTSLPLPLMSSSSPLVFRQPIPAAFELHFSAVCAGQHILQCDSR